MMVELAQKFFRAGKQRLEAAEVLYVSDKLLDSLYLVGYCVECSMKAMILSRITESRRASFVDQNFMGQRAHDFEFLRHLWKQHHCEPISADLRKAMRIFDGWSTSLRYDVGRRKIADVRAALDFAREFSSWVERRM